MDKEKFSKDLGRQMRYVRMGKGLSLGAVQATSGGRFRASRLGSYERAQRHILPEDLDELARFYGVPVADLLPAA